MGCTNELIELMCRCVEFNKILRVAHLYSKRSSIRRPISSISLGRLTPHGSRAVECRSNYTMNGDRPHAYNHFSRYDAVEPISCYNRLGIF